MSRPMAGRTGRTARPGQFDRMAGSGPAGEVLARFFGSDVIWWPRPGRPSALSGPFADLVGPPDGEEPRSAPAHERDAWIHVIPAAWAEDGGVVGDADRQRHVDLVLDVDDLAAHGSRIWWRPASLVGGGGSAPAVAVGGLRRAAAVAIGKRFEQLGIIEVTPPRLLFVPCADSVPTAERHREQDGTTYRPDWNDLDRWWSAHEAAMSAAGLDTGPVATCTACGSSHLQEPLYGMPIGPPPVWLAVMGCMLVGAPSSTRCQACGHEW